MMRPTQPYITSIANEATQGSMAEAILNHVFNLHSLLLNTIMERWPSGLRHLSRKQWAQQWAPGFESLSLRQYERPVDKPVIYGAFLHF